MPKTAMRTVAILMSLLLICPIEPKLFPGFFVPEEVQTLLQLVYSRLPPTRIGSDKRFGVGFRIGKNADAQILVELGPQSETRTLGVSPSPSKRESRKRKYTAEDKTADYRTALDKSADYRATVTSTADTNTALDKTTDPSINTVDSNVQKKPEPFLNVFLRWLTRLTQAREHDNKNNS